MAVNVSPAPVVLWNFVGGNGLIWDIVTIEVEAGNDDEEDEDEFEVDRISISCEPFVVIAFIYVYFLEAAEADFPKLLTNH